ncbi:MULTISPECIES: HAD family hydrolase [Dickeya]|uniref:phosphoglycolate phosphatase n=2 Tax=Dickeya TaxID=204037 RepID=A0A375A792_9GAMM|nr:MULTISPECIES: HAD hydrolase-like protein [Dickeya]WFN57119.1 HAD hydrolase-like protein [Dickeya lacustris]SLM61885.1 haloacid dehalogenase-like hydrolase, putative [Dickeya aquatica]
MRVEQFSHIVFDMDGVLIDSNPFKISVAKRVMQSILPEAAMVFAEHFRKNFGQTRKAHFTWAYENVLARHGFTEEIVDTLIEQYGKLIAENYASCDVTAGTRSLLSQLHRPCYVLTGSDQHEARALLGGHQLNTQFVDILGGPVNKSDNLKNVIHTYGINPAESVFIGDALHDFEVASHFGLSFILVTQYMPFDNQALIEKVISSGGYVIDTLSDLLIDRLNK